MWNTVRLLSVMPLTALFIDYAVAMQKVEPAGTRRALTTYSRETVKPAILRTPTVANQRIVSA